MSVLCCGCLQSQESGFLTPVFLLAETWEAKRDVEPSNSAPLKRATLKSSSMPQILSASLRWDSLHMAGNLIYWKTLKDKSGDILYLSHCQHSTFKNKLIWLTSVVCVAKASCTKWHVHSFLWTSTGFILIRSNMHTNAKSNQLNITPRLKIVPG